MNTLRRSAIYFAPDISTSADVDTKTSFGRTGRELDLVALPGIHFEPEAIPSGLKLGAVAGTHALNGSVRFVGESEASDVFVGSYTVGAAGLSGLFYQPELKVFLDHRPDIGTSGTVTRSEGKSQERERAACRESASPTPRARGRADDPRDLGHFVRRSSEFHPMTPKREYDQ